MEKIRFSQICSPLGIKKRKTPLNNRAESNAPTQGLRNHSIIRKEIVVTFSNRAMLDKEVYMLLRYMIMMKPYSPR